MLKNQVRLKRVITSTYEKLYQKHKPGFIIIGAQKAGTSSLHYYLNQHPRLQGSSPKEIHYFDKWINYGRDITWYENHFRSIYSKGRMFYESSPNYIYHESAATHLSHYYPSIKMILILRDPIDRAYSAWNMYREFFNAGYRFNGRRGESPHERNTIFQYFYEGRDEFISFKEAVEIEQEIITRGGPSEPAILRRGIYSEQLKKYYKYFNKNQILLIGFRELVTDTEKILCKIYRFLGVDDYSYTKIKLNIQNKRAYDTPIEQGAVKYLHDYYSRYNQELIDMIGDKIKW